MKRLFVVCLISIFSAGSLKAQGPRLINIKEGHLNANGQSWDLLKKDNKTLILHPGGVFNLDVIFTRDQRFENPCSARDVARCVLRVWFNQSAVYGDSINHRFAFEKEIHLFSTGEIPSQYVKKGPGALFVQVLKYDRQVEIFGYMHIPVLIE